MTKTKTKPKTKTKKITDTDRIEFLIKHAEKIEVAEFPVPRKNGGNAQDLRKIIDESIKEYSFETTWSLLVPRHADDCFYRVETMSRDWLAVGLGVESVVVTARHIDCSNNFNDISSVFNINNSSEHKTMATIYRLKLRQYNVPDNIKKLVDETKFPNRLQADRFRLKLKKQGYFPEIVKEGEWRQKSEKSALQSY